MVLWIQGESCFSPVQMPGLAWVEITYLSPSKGCIHPARNSFQENIDATVKNKSCVQSFVFVGDMISMGQSLHLTSYQPRWEFYIGTYLPDVLEKHLICAFHVSLTLALLNSLPVCFLQIIGHFSMLISFDQLRKSYRFDLGLQWAFNRLQNESNVKTYLRHNSETRFDNSLGL